jgi:Ca2+-binding EF-hand superfamily protein
MNALAFTIRQIDKDHNGYVTVNEMDDILKILYPKELDKADLKAIFKPFCSSANKVLLDYRLFKKFLRLDLDSNFASLDQEDYRTKQYLTNPIFQNPTQERV